MLSCRFLADHRDIREYIVTARCPFWTRVDTVCALLVILAGLSKLYQLGPLWFGVILSAVPLLLRTAFKLTQVKEERVLVVQDLGIQLSTVYWTGRHADTFIDKDKIKDIIINEGITRCKVIFYMSIMLEGEENMRLVFSHIFLRLPLILKVYRGIRAVIYQELEED